MSRPNYTQGKRRREAEKAKKKQEKAEKKRRKRDNGTGGIPVATVEEIQVAAMQEEATLPREPGEIDESLPDVPMRLFVGGLSWGTTEVELEAAFAQHGKVNEAVVVLDRDTGRSRGFGFVTMANSKDATKAMKAIDGTDLDGRIVKVNPAVERN